MPDDTGQKLVDTLATLACLGTLVTGVAGLVMAAKFTIPAGSDYSGGPSTVVGLCLVASALSFGMLLNALWRK